VNTVVASSYVPIAAIVVPIILGILLLVGIILLIVFCCKKKHNNRNHNHSHATAEQFEPPIELSHNQQQEPIPSAPPVNAVPVYSASSVPVQSSYTPYANTNEPMIALVAATTGQLRYTEVRKEKTEDVLVCSSLISHLVNIFLHLLFMFLVEISLHISRSHIFAISLFISFRFICSHLVLILLFCHIVLNFISFISYFSIKANLRNCCIICMTDPKNALLRPCMHVCTCVKDAVNFTECPMW
jgi:hypothetical protein